ncbi:MAG TPA: TetR family transcriptional regulator [Rhizomicrobium sp.]|jgi:AcrR family transcriptional regulator|nr:TetR family transcriptional regulator [Rhizomicrobium sp.]
MGEVLVRRERRVRDASRAASRAAILDAARRVAARDGARDLSLRGVAAEAGFAPAALYGYFRNKDELLLALAADDLSMLARAMRDSRGSAASGLAGAGAAALDLLRGAETMAAASAALADSKGSGDRNTGDAERLFNGRLIAALKALSDAAGLPADSRESQCDVVLVAASLAGLALLARSGRLAALGFTPEEMIARLDGRFRAP